jgi:hypothetical protein
MSLPRVVDYTHLVDLSGSDSDGEIGRSGESILAIVHHRMVGSVESTIREFTDASLSGQARRVSSQFGIGFQGSELIIAQFVALENTAYCNGQSAADRSACTWQLWLHAGRPPANRITVSIEHEDNGSAGDYIVVEPIIQASIELDRLLLSGDGPAIRAHGIHCSDLAAHQLSLVEPSTQTLVDHHVVSPVSKPYCWRPYGGDKVGFPQARYVRELTTAGEDDMGLVIDQYAASPGTLRVKGSGHSFIQPGTGQLVPVPDGWPGAEGKAVVTKGVVGEDFKTPGGAIIHKGVPLYMTGDRQAAFLQQDVTFTPAPPPAVTVEACKPFIDEATAAVRTTTANKAAGIAGNAAAQIKALGG